jgi:hypothetical protein
MSNPLTILVWEFKNAPQEYQDLSTNGGDEDWLVFVSNDILNSNSEEWKYWTPFWIQAMDSCREPQEIKIKEGMIFIGSHT